MNVNDKLQDLQKIFLKLEKNKDMAMKLMEQGKISDKRAMEWHNVIYNIRILLVTVKRNHNLKNIEIIKMITELKKGMLLTKDLAKKEKEAKEKEIEEKS